MTCRPSAGAQPGTLHTLRDRISGKQEVFEWTGRSWSTPGTGWGTKASLMDALGWRYVGALVPLSPVCPVHGHGRITPPAMVTPGAAGCTSGLPVLAAANPARDQGPCTVCGVPWAKHGTAPTCASHDYAPAGALVGEPVDGPGGSRHWQPMPSAIRGNDAR
jgi:hypothetical protein